MHLRTALTACLLALVLSLGGCGSQSAEETAQPDQGGRSQAEALLLQRKALDEQRAGLEARRQQLLADYNSFDAPARRVRLERAIQDLEHQEAEVQARLQRSGLFPNNLRYAVPRQEPAEATAVAQVQPAPGETAPAPQVEPAGVAEPAGSAQQRPLLEQAADATPKSAAAPGVLGVTSALRGAALEVAIATATPNPQFKTFVMTNPPRLVVDTPAKAAPQPASQRLSLDAPRAKSARLGWHPEWPGVRVVIDCEGAVPPHTVTATAQGIRVLLHP